MHSSGVKRDKKCNRCEAREYIHPVPRAGKQAKSVKRGEKCNRYQLSSAGIHTVKSGKTGKRCQAPGKMQPVSSAGIHERENRQPVPSAGKNAAGVRRGKTQVTGVKGGKTGKRCQIAPSAVAYRSFFRFSIFFFFFFPLCIVLFGFL